MVSKVLFSSKKMDCETPQDFFNKLDDEFDFICDLAANRSNSKCDDYIGEDTDSLTLPWHKYTNCTFGYGWLWLNPPYGRQLIKWVKKAYDESLLGANIVMLIPSRTDTKYFHDYIYNKSNVEIRFVKGRLKFDNSKNAAPFPSMVVIFHGQNR